MKSLLFVLPFLLAAPALAADPLVVHNFDQPAWDASHGLELSNELRIGGGQSQIQFGNIVRIACDSKGQIIVADYTRNEIRKFGADGALIGPIGKAGDGPDEYRFVVAIGEDSQDNLYVVGSKRVRVYDATGTFVTDFRDNSPNLVRCVRVLPDASLLLAEYDAQTNAVLQKYVEKKHAAHFGAPFNFSGQYKDEMMMAYAGGFIDVGADGMIYYTQMSPYEIRKYTPSGDLVMQVFRENSFVTAPHVERKGGSMIFHSYSGSVGIFALPDGKLMNVVGVVDGDGKPASTVLDVFDSEGHLLLSHRLERYFTPQWCDPSGNLYTFDPDSLAVVRSHLSIH
jgi:6-bladed beta-propeller